MLPSSENLDEFLGHVLRGVSKIVGCNSTNLVVINEQTREMSVRVGVTVVSYPELRELERALGESLRGLSVPVERARGSKLYEVWSEGAVFETSSLAEILGGVLDRDMLRQFDGMIGDHRFLWAPAASSRRCYGVLLFEKPGSDPFSRQQREVLLRYARRIGEIIESGLIVRREQIQLPAAVGRCWHVVADARGRIIGADATWGLPASGYEKTLGEEVRRFLASDIEVETVLLGSEGALRLGLVRLELQAEPAALCVLEQLQVLSSSKAEKQLLQLSLTEPAPALFLDADGRITSCNQAAEKLFGQEASQLQERRVTSLFCDPDAIDQLLSNQALYPDAPLGEVSTVVRHADGSLSPARVEAVLLADERSDVAGFLVLLRTPSGQRFTAEQLVRQERLATMGEMAAQLAHEIRNPLLAIGATLESLAHETLDDRPRDMLAAATREISRMDMILRKYLSVRAAVQRSDVHLDALLDEIRRLFEGARRQAGKRIVCETEPGLVLRADGDALKHVLFNLVLNALDVTPQEGQVRISARRLGEDVEIAVLDDGPGLAASAEQCLQPFFTTKPSGTGLGLAVCQKIAQAHGGLIQLSSRDTGGCRAAVVLPVLPRSAGT
ncbi:MAG: PAS domain S-box protein [Deltaproteobacteria bacterium]|nr:PAS domain S-box protein [Deltaproteobacteria bacterium]